jgi:hypothetical protein
MDLRETVPSVCSETGLTVTADGRVEEVLQTQVKEQEEENRLAVALTAVQASDKVCYVM